ncbi:MAG: translation initiation factor IF-2 [Sphaerochaetaceae bacterium]|nr:translation initiation factor IF-2 [Sphaerochaetaceae bacterium]
MNNENKPKVTIIKKSPVKEQKEQEKSTASTSVQPKVTVIKRVQQTVKVKPKEEPKKEEKTEEKKITVSPALGIKKEAPVQPKPAAQTRPVVKRPVRTGAMAPEANKNIIRGERIASNLHNGPVIIKSGNLPPVPGQKVDTPAPTNRPRVAGIVGGKPTRTPGQRSFGNFDRKNGQNGGFNRNNNGEGGRNFGNKNNQGGFNRNNNGQGGRPFGNRPFTPRPNQGGAGESVDLNQKGNQRKAPTNSKKKSEDYRNRRDQEIDFQYQLKKKEESKLAAVPKSIDIMENITVAELAKKMNLKPADIISKLFKMGTMVTINQQIDHETAEIICSEYNCEVHLVSLYDETIIEEEVDNEEDLVPRSPIVTIMGHVDHGKTKLLDAIRSTNVVAGEFGGITQHIGAYKVKVPGKVDVVFLDTPGHAAFSMMRARGAQVTDIVVLVVAANDGVMPQTREAIDHAMAAKVPIIVAINKVDLPEANPDRVMQQLSEIGLVPEEWGGQTLYCKISALKKEGIDDLLETILLQAEMLELKANPNCRAVGKVLESRIDQGRGTVATVMVQKGTLRQGDYYVAGIYPGRVRAMFDDKGKKIKEAGPSTPVEIIGLSDVPSAGDPFQVTEDEKTARTIGAKRQELEKLGAGAGGNKVTLENLSEKIKEGSIQDFNVIIKGDVQGSVEALQSTLEKLSTPEIRLKAIRAAAGAIIESDITLASASNALVIGFNVRPTPRAQVLAEQEKVEIKKYNVIYDVVDDVKAAMEGMLSPDIKEVDIGKGEVRDTFRVPKVGVVAGVYITEGKVTRNCFVRVIRDSIQINQENIKMSSLKRFKDDAKEVTVGYECGVGLENFQDIQVGDQLEFVLKQEVARKLDFEL